MDHRRGIFGGALPPAGFWLLLLLAAGGAGGATLTVTTTADDVTVNSNCTLREALAAANTNAAVDACGAGSAVVTDVVIVPAGSYLLSVTGSGEDGGLSGDLDLLDDVEIRGAGARSTTIDGGGIDRVFDVDPGFSGIVVRISDLRLTGGDAGGGEGGGVRNSGTLTLERVAIQGNDAAGPGGGIRNNGNVTLRASTLSANSTNDHGGGIDNHGSATLVNVTVIGNSVAGGGAGGGLYVNTGETMTLIGSTVLGNTAGLGPAIRNLGSLTAVASIVSGTCSGTVTSGGGNLETPGNTCGLGAMDQVNVADPLLEPFADYGGPTDTLRPLPGSPAVDLASPSSCPGIDQRGFHRVEDGDGDLLPRCDAGAHELGGAAPLFSDGFEGGGLGGWSASVP